MRIICISDTHNYTPDVPDGDILIHAGDSTSRGYDHEIKDFGEWLRTLPHAHKVVIAGNHDFAFQDSHDYAIRCLLGNPIVASNIHYLQDSEVTLSINGETLRLYGSPWQPEFFNWAFNLTDTELFTKWTLIPKNIDVLITHGPPKSILDITSSGDVVGCRHLLDAVLDIKPKLHVFGHIHESHGVFQNENTIFANASICTRRYAPSQPPIIIDYKDGVMTHVRID